MHMHTAIPTPPHTHTHTKSKSLTSTNPTGSLRALIKISPMFCSTWWHTEWCVSTHRWSSLTETQTNNTLNTHKHTLTYTHMHLTEIFRCVKFLIYIRKWKNTFNKIAVPVDQWTIEWLWNFLFLFLFFVQASCKEEYKILLFFWQYK